MFLIMVQKVREKERERKKETKRRRRKNEMNKIIKLANKTVF